MVSFKPWVSYSVACPPPITTGELTTIVIVSIPKAVTESVAVTVSMYVPIAVVLSAVTMPLWLIDTPDTAGAMVKVRVPVPLAETNCAEESAWPTVV